MLLSCRIEMLRCVQKINARAAVRREAEYGVGRLLDKSERLPAK